MQTIYVSINKVVKNLKTCETEMVFSGEDKVLIKTVY